MLAVFAAGVALRAVNLGGPAFGFDEFYDVFAARRWLAGEGFTMPYGPYTRARLVTLLTAGAFALLGESEATARLPALAFGILTLALIYVAGRALFGPTAGLVALALLAFSPDAIDVDRFARLYSPLTFFSLLAAFAAFRALEGAGDGAAPAPTRRLGWLALAVAAGVAAAHLHTAAVGLVTVVQLYAAARGLGLFLAGRRAAAAPYAAVAAGLLLAEGIGVVAIPGLRARVAEAMLVPLPWYRPASGDALLYHHHLATQYAWLWALLWPATVALVVARPRAGLFVAVAFWLPFAVLSVAVATKAPRYIVHLLPFAWLVLGGAVQVLWPAARAAIAVRLDPVLPAAVPRQASAAATVLIAAVPLIGLSPSLAAAVRRPWQTTGTHFTTNFFYDWRGLARALGPHLGPQARIVSGGPLAVRYYLGRPADRLVSADHRAGDSPDRLAERRVQEAADLSDLRAGGVPVWVIVERWRWETSGKLDAGLKRVLGGECRTAAIPPTPDFLVFVCDPVARREVDRPAAGGSGTAR